MSPIRKLFFFLFILITIPNCATINKKAQSISPEELLKTYKLSIPFPECKAVELSGVFYLFSKRQNFRGKFYIKGNLDYPYLLEIKWTIGTVLSVSEIKKDEIKIYSTRDRKLYVIKEPKNMFVLFGLSQKIAPEFYIKVLTGEWKKFMSSPKKAEKFSSGIKYFFKNKYFSEVSIDYSLKKAVIMLNCGGEIDIFKDKKIVFRDKDIGEIIFKIEKRKYKNIKYKSNYLELEVPKGIKKVIIN